MKQEIKISMKIVSKKLIIKALSLRTILDMNIKFWLDFKGGD